MYKIIIIIITIVNESLLINNVYLMILFNHCNNLTL